MCGCFWCFLGGCDVCCLGCFVGLWVVLGVGVWECFWSVLLGFCCVFWLRPSYGIDSAEVRFNVGSWPVDSGWFCGG